MICNRSITGAVFVTAIALLLFSLVACAGRVSVPTDVTVQRDAVYGEDDAQRMDLYLPHGAKNAPVIFMVHGGAWRIGDKGHAASVENKMRRWTQRGFIFISTNYRMLPDADPLTQADDVARALATAQKRAREKGGDPEKFILMGHSAGAHLVSLLNAAPQRAIALGAHPWLGTVSLDTAAMDMVKVMEREHHRFYDNAFGKDRAYWKAASPLRILEPEAGPVLMVCSSERPDKPCNDARTFAARARQLGVRAEVLPQAKSHREINNELGLAGAYTEAIEAFMGSLDPAVKRLLQQNP